MPAVPKSIRLALHGCANRPFYHIVVVPRHKGRNARPLEQLGTYDPMPNNNNEKMVGINFDRLRYWLGKGAHTTMPVSKLLGLCGFFPIHPMTYTDAGRLREGAKEKPSEDCSTETNIEETSHS